MVARYKIYFMWVTEIVFDTIPYKINNPVNKCSSRMTGITCGFSCKLCELKCQNRE